MNNTCYHQDCESIQISISDVIDSDVSIDSELLDHISACSECTEFYNLWKDDSPLSAIASGALADQNNLSDPIIGKLTESKLCEDSAYQKITSINLFKVAAIAAVCIFAALASVDLLSTPEEITSPPQDSNMTESDKITTPIKITLSEEKIEEALTKNYQILSQSATEKWKQVITKVNAASSYISTKTQYISDKYLESDSDASKHPHSHAIPKQVDQDQTHYV